MSRLTAVSLLRWLRRVPGYRAVSVPVVRRLRASDLAVDLTTRLFPPDYDPASTRTPLRAGSLHGPDVDRLPVVAFLALGRESSDITQVLESVLQLQRQSRSFRPVIVVDQPAFAEARRADVVMDHLVPRSGWHPLLAGDVTYDSYVAQRILDLRKHYPLVHLVHVTGPTIAEVDCQVIHQLARWLPQDLDVAVTPSALSGEQG